MEAELFDAIKSNDLEKVKKLIENGVDVNTKNDKEEIPLTYAFEYENFDIMKYLIENGADVNVKMYPEDYILTFAISDEYFDIAKLLINNGADVNVKDSCEKTALMNSCYEGNYEISKLLIDKGADVNARDEEGETALMEAFSASYHVNDNNKKEEYVKIIKLLIDNGANVNAKNNNNDKFLDLLGDDYVEKEIKEYIKTKKKSKALKPLNLKLPEGVVCFDEIEHCDVLVKDFVKSTDTILIKIGDNIKGYNRLDIIEYYNTKKSLYSKEKLYPGEFEKIKNKKNMFFSTVDTGKNTFVLIPQTKEKFFS
jgi:ankyrin repeat protein